MPQAVDASAGRAEPQAWSSLFSEDGLGPGIPLGTARWMSPAAAAERYAYRGSLSDGRTWIGEAFDDRSTALGYVDDRHVTLVSGSRGGKGVGVIVPNLCCWPGSAIVVDPKGENATVTARRRRKGSVYTHGMGQKVCILDPFGEVELPDALKARYNPLDAIDPKSDFAIDDAGRVAAALVVIENRNDPYWEEAARNLIKGLILHVLSSMQFEGRRNLVTVRRLLTQGDWLTAQRLRDAGEEVPSAFILLWKQMQRSKAFNGVVAGVGEQLDMMADKQRSGVLESARTSTEFLDSVPMQRLLEESDFDLAELKTNPDGLTIYLTLPARYMETHFRWLRLMISLAIGEMERIKQRPAAGHPTLFLLDEFAGLKRMEVVENAAAQAAGFGVKFLFVVQNLPQIEDLYEKSWETFLGNSGLKLFFQIDDDFTRSYVSRQLGDLETVRQTRSGSSSQSTSTSTTTGSSDTDGTSYGTTRSAWFHIPKSRQTSSSSSTSRSSSFSQGQSGSTSEGWNEGVHRRPLLNPDEIGRMLARIGDRSRPGYPGLVLALIPGEHPLLARRTNYFESNWFLGYFDPHPQHPPPPTLAELLARARTREPEPEPEVLTFKPKPAATPRSFKFNPEHIGWVLVGVAALIALAISLGNSGRSGNSYSSNASASTAAPSSANSAYAQGVADCRSLRVWFADQAGAQLAGANWWAAHRNVRGHEGCDEAAENYNGSGSVFETGCLDAKRMLDAIDARRAVDPQYRTGFNDEAKRNPM